MAAALHQTHSTGAGRRSERGSSLLEATLAMGLSGFLAVLGVSGFNPGHADLTAAQAELTESLDQAFVLARARGTNVTVGLASGQDANHLPLRLCRRVKWGKPAHMPMPPGMEDTAKAATTGEAHASITVTPRHTATASCWFLNDGEEALCMRLSNRGRVQMLRWRSRTRKWGRA